MGKLQDYLARVEIPKEMLDVEVTGDDREMMHAFMPQEGRYRRYTRELGGITSEFQWTKRRLELEIEYMIGLGDELQNYTGKRKKIIEHPFSDGEREALKGFYRNFSEIDYKRFKNIEGKKKHDVVATIILGIHNMGDVIPIELMEKSMHYGRTSSDINSNVFSLMVHDIIRDYYLPKILRLQSLFIEDADSWHNVPEKYPRPFTVIAGQTHEEYAVPTIFRKVLSNLVKDIHKGMSKLIVPGLEGPETFKLNGKMGGAVGNDGSMIAAYPRHDWGAFYRKFIEDLGLRYEPTCDQDESNMDFLEFRDLIRRISNPLIKWCDDYSSYLSRKLLEIISEGSARGSSAMPHKQVNPWNTEGAEAFLYLANAELGVYDLLGRYRKQGDLRRSVLKRYIGVPFSNIGIALCRIIEDLKNTRPNYTGIEKDLSEHAEISVASMQAILRAEGVSGAYDHMAKKTKGKQLTREMMESIVSEMEREETITKDTGDDIRTVFDHENNIGNALEIADDDLAAANETVGKIKDLYNLD